MAKVTSVKQPLISVDAVALRLHNKKMQILLVERWNDPFSGMLALPGVLLDTNESISDAIERALFDKADVSGGDYRGMEQIGVFDETNRDPRGATISVSNFAFLRKDAPTSGTWVNIDEMPELPFDHAKIIERALSRLERPTEELMWGIFGDFFTTGDYAFMLQDLGVEVDRPNLSRVIPARLDVKKVTSSLNGRKLTMWSLEKWRESHSPK